MPHITFHPLPVKVGTSYRAENRAKFDAPYGDVFPTYVWGERLTVGTSVTLLDVGPIRVRQAKRYILHEQVQKPVVHLLDEKRARQILEADLPDYLETEWIIRQCGSLKLAITVSDEYLEQTLRELVMRRHHEIALRRHTKEGVFGPVKIDRYHWLADARAAMASCYDRVQRALGMMIRVSTDIDYADDIFVSTSYMEASFRTKIGMTVYDPRRRWMPTDEIEVSTAVTPLARLEPHQRTAGAVIRYKADRGVSEHLDSMDDTYKSIVPFRRIQKQFGTCERPDSTQVIERRPDSRALVLHDSRPEFSPRYIDYTDFHHSFLVLRTTPSGRFGPLDVPKFRDKTRVEQSAVDRVYCHSDGVSHRFIFWDHRETGLSLIAPVRALAIIPVRVNYDECVQFADLPVERGMDPELTAAMSATPYFVSALKHALNRRAYLRSKIDWTPGCGDFKPDLKVPVVWRSDATRRLYGGRYSRAGRRSQYDRLNDPFHAVNELTKGMMPNQLPIQPESALQRVAPEANPVGSRRAVRLDL